MTTHRAMKALAENPHAVRSLAAHLLAAGGSEQSAVWTDWEIEFLGDMAGRTSDEPLSMRQREVLSDLKNALERYAEIDGLSVRSLIEHCWLERFYLDDENASQFIADLKETGQRSVTRRQLGCLLRCCRQLGLIENHQGFAN